LQFGNSLFSVQGPTMGQTGGVAVRRDELMGPDLLSEIVIALGGAVLFLFLMLTLITALAAR
jgi:hypothetical protein